MLPRANRNHPALVGFFFLAIFWGGFYYCTFLFSDDLSYLIGLLNESEKQARKVSDEENRFSLLDDIAFYRARTGQIEEAQKLIKHLEPEYAKNYSDPKYIFEEIAKQMARSGNVEAALEAARTAGSVSKTVEVVVRANKSKPISANEAAGYASKVKQSPFPRQSDEALYSVAEELLKRGMLEDVNKILQQVDRPDNIRREAQVLNNLAAIAVARGWKDYGSNLFQRADALSSECISKSGLQAATVELALSIAAQRRLCGDITGANNMFSAVQKQLAKITDQSKREQYLNTFSEAAAVSGDFELAKKTLELITEPMRITQARDALVRALLAEGRIEEAEMIEPSIPNLDTRISILLLTAELKIDRKEASAQKTLDLLERYLEEGSDNHKAWETANLASIEYKRGNRARAISLWKEAIKLSDRFTIHPDREKANLIKYVIRLQAEAGEEQCAMETARLIEDDDVFFDIAEAESANGKTESASKWINKLKNPGKKARSLLGVVSGLLDTLNAKESTRAFQYVALSECK
jgi:tetratricopeptide (TPR) repeat protein